MLDNESSAPHPLGRFPVPRFWLLLKILFALICCLFGFHQAEISILSKDATTRRERVGLNQRPHDPDRRQNGALNHSATLPTFGILQLNCLFSRMRFLSAPMLGIIRKLIDLPFATMLSLTRTTCTVRM